MNSPRGSTPPNPNLDLPNRSTDLNKTSGTLGTPHEESIAKFNPPKLVQKGGIKEIPPRALPTQELKKPQNRAPLLTDLGGESQPREPRRVPTNISHQIPKRKVPKTTQRNHKERAPKITTKNNWGKHIQTLRNHAESSIHETKVHTRSRKLPDHPSLSTRSLREAPLLVLKKN
jgi:hypothetical protein